MAGLSSKLPSTSVDITARPKDLDITIGCEFEFIIAEYRPIQGKVTDDVYNMHTRQAQYAVREALKQPFKIPCPGCKQYSFMLPVSATEVADPTKWQVGTDNTINTIDGFYELAESMQDYTFYPIEIRSRKLHLNVVDKDFWHHHVPTYQEEVGSVLDRVNAYFGNVDEFEPKPGKYFAFVNSSCGFHVHIGNNKDTIPTEAVRKILCLLTACEKQLDCLHGSNRITGFDFSKPPHGLPRSVLPGVEVINDDVNSLPLSMVFTAEANEYRWFDRNNHGTDLINHKQLLINEFYLKVHDPQADFTEDDIWVAHRLCDVDSWLTVLRCAKGMAGLKNRFQRIGRKCTVNVQNLPTQDTDQYKRRTIEFRQHVATLDSSTALNFIEVLIRLVTFCHQESDSLFYPIITRGGRFRKATFTPHDLIKELGCALDTRAYYMRKFDQPDNHTSPLSDHQSQDDLGRSTLASTLALQMDSWQRDNYRPAKMQAHIMHKLMCAGYGHFPAQYLEDILPPDIPCNIDGGDREKLIARLGVDHILPLVEVDPSGVVPVGISVEGYDIIEDGGAENETRDMANTFELAAPATSTTGISPAIQPKAVEAEQQASPSTKSRFMKRLSWGRTKAESSSNVPGDESSSAPPKGKENAKNRRRLSKDVFEMTRLTKIMD